jgi:hypothetical protein
MLEDQTLNCPEVVSRNPAILGKTNRLKPELALAFRRTNVDMRGFA